MTEGTDQPNKSMGIFDWLFGKKKTASESKQNDVDKTAPEKRKSLLNQKKQLKNQRSS